MRDSDTIEIEDDDATRFLVACLDEWQNDGGDCVALVEAMAQFVDDVHRAATPVH